MLLFFQGVDHPQRVVELGNVGHDLLSDRAVRVISVHKAGIVGSDPPTELALDPPDVTLLFRGEVDVLSQPLDGPDAVADLILPLSVNAHVCPPCDLRARALRTS